MAKLNQNGNTWMNRVLVEHPALLISALYLIASLIGLVYSWTFFSFFEINIFRYAEIGDFLMASLKEPSTWLLASLAVALVLLDNANSRRVQNKGVARLYRWYAAPLYRRINILVAIVIMAMFLYGFARQQSLDIRSGDRDRVTIRLADESPPINRVMLGTTGRFAFFFDPGNERVYVYPHESILSLSKPAPDPGRKR
jgi:hypothetical protein